MPNVRLIRTEDADAAVSVLTSSFHGYPFLDRTFANAKEPVEAMRRRMFLIAVDGRLAGFGESWVVEHNGEVIAVANLSDLAGRDWPEELKKRWEELEADLADHGRAMFEAYTALQAAAFSEGPHVYVVAIGVKPGHQGKGYGRLLLNTIAAEHPSLPIRLDTHEPANLAKYLGLGFKMVFEGDLLGVKNWFFERAE